MNQLTVNTKNKNYEIIFNNNFEGLLHEIKKLNITISKIAIITDDHVGPLYYDQVKECLRTLYPEIYCFTFLHGEKSKNLNTISDIYAFMIEQKLDRKSLVIALGGGVVGDMAGFAAATYMRGIKFIQVPTTLLSQVDSSVGGKTGVDFNGYKNIVGAFYQPELVYINTRTLKSLPKNEFCSGMGEVIKHGLILDQNYYNEIEKNRDHILNLDHDILQTLIYNSCKIKSQIVSEDEKEEGCRALLNFGHTVGHAIERLKNFELLHGECISIGFVAALHISEQLGHITEVTINRVIDLLKAFELPTAVVGLEPIDIYNEMFHDKKTSSNQLNFVLLTEIGKSYINNSVEEEVVMKAIQKIILK
ncbi:MAG: 3-dehydroquinate synthase [Firmicutes bacterium HGW-Firmicutes-1]|jgi:3-dehydroquinate synthase|nr:MAG: 3-dehydroquinate synthase [Firmicutes bacterium HGW-Firmicutes-1]